MKAHLTRRYRFSSSHRLHSAEMSAEENVVPTANATTPTDTATTTRSKSRSAARSTPAPAWSATSSTSTASSNREVLARYHLENLNTLQEFAQHVPTTENLCDRHLRNIAARLSQSASGTCETRRNHDELLRVHSYRRAQKVAAKKSRFVSGHGFSHAVRP